MNLDGLLIEPEAILTGLAAPTKRAALGAMSEALARACGLDPRAVLEAIWLREQLAPTGIGEGVAIPHVRMAELASPVAGLAVLANPIDFGAPDERPADILVMLLTPSDRAGDHLKALAKVTRALKRNDFRERLRSARSRDDIVGIVAEESGRDAA